jgi:hypothetical protein
VSELPRLDDLVGLADRRRDSPYWVLKGDVGNRGRKQQSNKVKRRLLSTVLLFPPSRPGGTKVGAWRVRNHQVPSAPENCGNVVLNVRAWPFCRKQVARNGVVARFDKSVPDDSGELTGDQNFHRVSFRVIRQTWI